MKKRYITTIVIRDDGSKSVHMYPMSKSCCWFVASLKVVLPYITIGGIVVALFWFLFSYKIAEKNEMVYVVGHKATDFIVTNIVLQCIQETRK